MITIYDFIAMNEREQAEAVWAGTFLMDRHEETHSIQLYNMGSFFVEVYYNRFDNKISRLRPFKTSQLLEPYLNGIRI